MFWKKNDTRLIKAHAYYLHLKFKLNTSKICLKKYFQNLNFKRRFAIGPKTSRKLAGPSGSTRLWIFLEENTSVNYIIICIKISLISILAYQHVIYYYIYFVTTRKIRLAFPFEGAKMFRGEIVGVDRDIRDWMHNIKGHNYDESRFINKILKFISLISESS